MGWGCGRRGCSASACPVLQARRDSRTPRRVESSGCPLPVPAAPWDFSANCSEDGRGSLLPGCRTGLWAHNFPLCSPGLVPQPRSEPLARRGAEPPVVSSEHQLLLEPVLCLVFLTAWSWGQCLCLQLGLMLSFVKAVTACYLCASSLDVGWEGSDCPEYLRPGCSCRC